MKLDRSKQRKKANPKKGLILVFVLFVIIYLFFNMEAIFEQIFGS